MVAVLTIEPDPHHSLAGLLRPDLLPDGKEPDLALEIALSSGGIRKLELYRQLSIPEVWIWRKSRLEMHGLRPDGSGYDPLEESRFLPGLSKSLIERCIAIEPWEEARRIFREGLRA